MVNKTNWGGHWTDEKLKVFSKYVIAYLKIMKKNPYWKTIYFDGFAGSGTRNQPASNELFKKLPISLEEQNLYKGAAEQVISLPNDFKFDYYYFIDLDKNALNKLEVRLNKISKKGKLIFRNDNVNNQLNLLATALKTKKLASLIFLDPFGMQIDWQSITQLQNTRSDIWILVPTGVIVNRLLDKKGKLKLSNKLESFFGLSIEEIKENFYKKQKVNTLFGEEEIISKISDPIKKISELYTKVSEQIYTKKSGYIFV